MPESALNTSSGKSQCNVFACVNYEDIKNAQNSIDNLSRITRKSVFGHSDQVHTNWAVRPQKVARGLKFRILKGSKGIVLSVSRKQRR